MQKGNSVTYICIELADKAGEIAVLEVLGQQISREFHLIPHNKTIVILTPRHHRIRRWIIHHFICLCKKRRRPRTALWSIHTWKAYTFQKKFHPPKPKQNLLYLLKPHQTPNPILCFQKDLNFRWESRLVAPSENRIRLKIKSKTK